MRTIGGFAYRNQGETPAVLTLLVIMGIVFIVDFYLHGAITQLLAWLPTIGWLRSLSPQSPWTIFQPLTFPFVHGTSFFYVLGDALVLYFFGGSLERAWGSAKFLLFFFLSGIVPGLVIMALSSFMVAGGLFYGMVGGFVSIVVAFATLSPYATVILFIFPLQARWLAVLAVLLELFGRSGFYGGPIPASIAVAATVGFAYLFTSIRFSLSGFIGGPSMKERLERWQQRRRWREWQRRVSRVERPEDLFRDKKER